MLLFSNDNYDYSYYYQGVTTSIKIHQSFRQEYVKVRCRSPTNYVYGVNKEDLTILKKKTAGIVYYLSIIESLFVNSNIETQIFIAWVLTKWSGEKMNMIGLGLIPVNEP